MKKKLLGITLITIISLNITSVNASEIQENTSETAVSSTSSSETAPSSGEADQTAEEVIEEEGNDVADLSQLDTTDGTVSMPRGRSDIVENQQFPY